MNLESSNANFIQINAAIIVNWAIDMTGVDSLAVSHYDVFNGLYTSAGIVEELSKPIIIKANGPRREDRMFT